MSSIFHILECIISLLDIPFTVEDKRERKKAIMSIDDESAMGHPDSSIRYGRVCCSGVRRVNVNVLKYLAYMELFCVLF